MLNDIGSTVQKIRETTTVAICNKTEDDDIQQ